jgi:hypothetical protein
VSDETTDVSPDESAEELSEESPEVSGDTEPDLDEARARIEEELAEARQRLSGTPADVVIVNHAMGLYELAAIHLSNQPPALDQAALSIDAFACLVEGLGERLGPNVGLLRDALSNIRLAFVQIKGAAASGDEAPTG